MFDCHYSHHKIDSLHTPDLISLYSCSVHVLVVLESILPQPIQ
jgi:hypothetical protein